MSKKGLAWAALAIGVSLFVGCATGGGSGTDEDDTGEGGEGGAGSGMGGAGPGPGPGPGASSSSSSSASGSASSSSSSSASSGGGGMCPAGQHMCAAGCMGNTPETGCLTSQTCAACPAVANGKTTCNAQGACDVSCNSGYNKNGNTCVCPNQCCSNAECASGQTCNAGTCGGGGGSCDDFACIAQCIFQGKSGGVCVSGTCTCI